MVCQSSYCCSEVSPLIQWESSLQVMLLKKLRWKSNAWKAFTPLKSVDGGWFGLVSCCEPFCCAVVRGVISSLGKLCRLIW